MIKNTIFIKNTISNCTPIIVDALANAVDTCENIISFEKGKYYFYREGSFIGLFYPSNNASGRKNVIFPILNKKNLTIDGNGSEFIFCDRVFPFIIQHSENITLKNFTVDFSFPRHAMGKVIQFDDEGFELEIDDNNFKFQVYKGNIDFFCGNDVISTHDKKLFFEDITRHVPVLYSFIGDCVDSKNNLAAPIMEVYAIKTNNGIRFNYLEPTKHANYCVNDDIFIGNDENRENDVFFAEFSSDLKFENINVFRGAGMGIIAQMTSDICIDGLKIIPSPHRDDNLSITADGLHFVNCYGQLIIKNSLIKDTVDDAINIHGVYSTVKSVIDSHTVEVQFMHQEQLGLIPYLAGDLIHINDKDTMNEVSMSKIKSVHYHENREALTLIFDEDISNVIMEGSILENPDRMPEIYIENCEFINCPHALISSSKKTVIKNNRFDLKLNDIRICDLIKYWYESGVVSDVSIENNIFTDRSKNKNISIDSTRKVSSNRKHGKILIANNVFLKGKEESIEFSSVDKLIELHNEFKS